MVQFGEELEFKDKEWTEEDKTNFIGSNSPIFITYHDGIVGGKIGF